MFQSECIDAFYHSLLQKQSVKVKTGIQYFFLLILQDCDSSPNL